MNLSPRRPSDWDVCQQANAVTARHSDRVTKLAFCAIFAAAACAVLGPAL